NPITKTNWEGTGVKPDVQVAAEQALDKAQELAVKKIMADAKDEETRRQIRMDVDRSSERPRTKLASEGKATPAQILEKELESLQGEWTMVALEQKGEKAPDEVVKEYRLTIKGEQWIVTPSEDEETKRSFRIDPSKDPRTIDLVIKTADKETVSRGI